MGISRTASVDWRNRVFATQDKVDSSTRKWKYQDRIFEITLYSIIKIV